MRKFPFTLVLGLIAFSTLAGVWLGYEVPPLEKEKVLTLVACIEKNVCSQPAEEVQMYGEIVRFLDVPDEKEEIFLALFPEGYLSVNVTSKETESVFSLQDRNLDGKVDWIRELSLIDGAVLQDHHVLESEKNRYQLFFNRKLDKVYERNMELLLQSGSHT